MTNFPLAREFLTLVRLGRKTSTIRRGIRNPGLGPAVLTSGIDKVPVVITGVRHIKFNSLTEADARSDGFDSLSELDAVLRRFYPGMTETDPVTVVYFTTV